VTVSSYACTRQISKSPPRAFCDTHRSRPSRSHRNQNLPGLCFGKQGSPKREDRKDKDSPRIQESTLQPMSLHEEYPENSLKIATATKVCWLVLLFVTVVVSRWLWITTFASELPFHDQWDGEMETLRRFMEGQLRWQDLFSAHNEHRIFWSRISWLLLFASNNHCYDNLVDTVALALLAGLTATLLATFYLRLTQWRSPWWVTAVLLISYCLPLAWQNMVWGFQFQMHYQILFALLAFYGMAFWKPFTPWWYVGTTSLVAGLFTSASGCFAGPCLIFVFLVEAIHKGRLNRETVLNTCICAAVFVVGVLMTPHVPWHDSLKATSVADFVSALGKHLAWPWQSHSWLALGINAPLILLLGLWLLGRLRLAEPPARFLVLVGAYSVSQMLAMAYSRGAGGWGVTPRYLDFYLLAVVTNLLSCRLLLSVAPLGTMVTRLPILALASIWITLLTAGAAIHLRAQFPPDGILSWTMGGWKSGSEIQRKNILEYLQNGTRSHLSGKNHHLEYGYPDGKRLMDRLDKYGPIDLLPYSISTGIPLAVEEATGVYENSKLPTEYKNGPGARADVVSGYAEKGGKGTWTSRLIDRGARYLLFDYVGMNASGSLSLRLKDIDGHTSGGAEFTETNLPKRLRGWREVVVEVNKVPYRIEARDSRSQGWFGFAPPRRVGRLTALLQSFEPYRWWSLAACMALWTLLLLWCLSTKRGPASTAAYP
jgi:hypothetical protein